MGCETGVECPVDCEYNDWKDLVCWSGCISTFQANPCEQCSQDSKKILIHGFSFSFCSFCQSSHLLPMLFAGLGAM